MIKERCIIPRYDFECGNCKKVFEEIVLYDETNKYKGVKCPFCASKRKKKIVASCNFMFSNPEGTNRWNSESSGHDYRFHHNLPKVIAERQAAEEHGGNSAPYNPINDLDNNDAWGEAK